MTFDTSVVAHVVFVAEATASEPSGFATVVGAVVAVIIAIPAFFVGRRVQQMFGESAHDRYHKKGVKLIGGRNQAGLIMAGVACFFTFSAVVAAVDFALDAAGSAWEKGVAGAESMYDDAAASAEALYDQASTELESATNSSDRSKSSNDAVDPEPSNRVTDNAPDVIVSPKPPPTTDAIAKPVDLVACTQFRKSMESVFIQLRERRGAGWHLKTEQRPRLDGFVDGAEQQLAVIEEQLDTMDRQEPVISLLAASKELRAALSATSANDRAQFDAAKAQFVSLMLKVKKN